MPSACVAGSRLSLAPPAPSATSPTLIRQRVSVRNLFAPPRRRRVFAPAPDPVRGRAAGLHAAPRPPPLSTSCAARACAAAGRVPSAANSPPVRCPRWAVGRPVCSLAAMDFTPPDARRPFLSGQRPRPVAAATPLPPRWYVYPLPPPVKRRYGLLRRSHLTTHGGFAAHALSLRPVGAMIAPLRRRLILVNSVISGRVNAGAACGTNSRLFGIRPPVWYDAGMNCREQKQRPPGIALPCGRLRGALGCHNARDCQSIP